MKTHNTAGKFKIASPSSDPDDDAVKEDTIVSIAISTLNGPLMLRSIFKTLVASTHFFGPIFRLWHGYDAQQGLFER
ncbi:hypothetical protein PFICI_13567 [Pestalotiopsis fici W106-1]|uniref:Uncharacterized protein n=1 Tax=Pestalotiopsis fici (strain W106-1 / CGMCC3.15140) TaxID=1229662 RepID=W3WMI7_PESFW|nr:uncharacterized protein PFICI_13567 [Pestalotiopsis fici W106-1]ETS75083.1 hypothetical protein PFICI_13567 [Pestalotiopsis fici W106-1]